MAEFAIGLDPLVQTRDTIVYSKVQYEDSIYTLGDIVKLNAGETTEAYVGVIERIFQQQNEDINVSIRWFYRWYDIKLKPNIPTYPNELLYSFHVDDNSVAALDGLCTVNYIRSSDEIPRNDFFVRFIFNNEENTVIELNEKAQEKFNHNRERKIEITKLLQRVGFLDANYLHTSNITVRSISTSPIFIDDSKKITIKRKKQMPPTPRKSNKKKKSQKIESPLEKKIRVINSDFGNDDDDSDTFGTAHSVKLKTSKSASSTPIKERPPASTRYSLRGVSSEPTDDFFPPSPEQRRYRKPKNTISSSSQPSPSSKSKKYNLDYYSTDNFNSLTKKNDFLNSGREKNEKSTVKNVSKTSKPLNSNYLNAYEDAEDNFQEDDENNFTISNLSSNYDDNDDLPSFKGKSSYLIDENEDINQDNDANEGFMELENDSFDQNNSNSENNQSNSSFPSNPSEIEEEEEDLNFINLEDPEEEMIEAPSIISSSGSSKLIKFKS